MILFVRSALCLSLFLVHSVSALVQDECPFYPIPEASPKRRLAACTAIEVANDAEFCVDALKAAVCSGKTRGLCPDLTSTSIGRCRKNMLSYNWEKGTCIPPEKADCVQQPDGDHICVFPSNKKVPSTQLPRGITPPLKTMVRKFKIITYNDVYQLEPTMEKGRLVGGASRMSQYVADIRQKEPNTLVLFAGDTLYPSLWSNVYQGQHMVKAHNQIKNDFTCLGNHEFDGGMEDFYEGVKASNFPWLNANCYDNQTNALLNNTIPHAIQEVNGVKIGLFGVIYNMKDTKRPIYFVDPLEAAKKQVDELRRKGAEFIIALTHLDSEDDTRVANEVEGLDLIVGGHDHEAMIQMATKVPYVKAEMDFKTIWDIDVEVNKQTKKNSMKFKSVPITAELSVDPVIEKIILELKPEVEKLYGKVVGYALDDVDVRESILRVRESSLATYISDSTRKFCGVPTAVSTTNGGAVRGDRVWTKGEITLGDVTEWLSFGNDLKKIWIRGNVFKNYISNALRHSCGIDGNVRPNGHIVQPSGFRYTFKCTGHREGVLAEIQWDREGFPSIKDDEVFTYGISFYEYGTDDAELLRKKSVVLDKGNGRKVLNCVLERLRQERCFDLKLDGRAKIFGREQD